MPSSDLPPPALPSLPQVLIIGAGGWGREVLALLLCLFAGVLAIYGYLRWLRNEKAMRLKQDLPYTRGLLIISAILLAVAGVVMVLVFYGG